MMDEIERIARKLSDRYFELMDYRFTYPWHIVADCLLSMGHVSGDVIQLARKLEFGTHAETICFFHNVERFSNEQK
jgi:hypothetical protein